MENTLREFKFANMDLCTIRTNSLDATYMRFPGGYFVSKDNVVRANFCNIEARIASIGETTVRLYHTCEINSDQKISTKRKKKRDS